MSDAAPFAGWFEGRTHVLPVRVYYEDTDLTGLVYHAGHVRFFERGRSDFLRLAGADHTAMAALGTAFAVTRLEIDFRRAARIDDALSVRTTFEHRRGAVFHIAQTIERDGVPIAVARVEVACIDAKGQARRPPPQLLQALSAKLSTGVELG